MCALWRRRHHKPPPAVTLSVAWVSLDPDYQAALLEQLVEALNLQVPDIRALWPHVKECSHRIGRPSAGEVYAELHLSIPEAPDALAYHSVDPNGVPFIRVGTQVCRQAGVSIESAASHEAAELTVDPSCTITVKAPNGGVWDLEVSDPVQASSYRVLTSSGPVEVSDFVGQSFFGMGSSSLDKTGNVTAPFTIAPGGYAVINGNQVLGRGARSWGDPDHSVRRP